MLYEILIEYEGGVKKKIQGVKEESIQNVIELHSKPLHGIVVSVHTSKQEKQDTDLDGYYAYANTLMTT